MSLPDLRGRAVWVFREDDYDIDRIIGVENIKITDIDALAALAVLIVLSAVVLVSVKGGEARRPASD